MIGKKEWFTRRKYSGWGLTPTTWQGFAYIAAIVIIGVTIGSVPLESTVKTLLSIILVIIFVADALHIMYTIKLDEREAKIEAIAERNASWAMIGTLASLLIYFAVQKITVTGTELMPYIFIPIMAGLFTKAVSTLILERKEL